VVGLNLGGTETFLNILEGTSPSFNDNDASLDTFSGVNLIGNNDIGRYDTSHFPGGNPFTTYASALALVGSLQVEDIVYADDNPAGSNETLFAIGGSVTLPCPADGYQVGYAANLPGTTSGGGSSSINIVNTGSSETGPGTGTLCVNIYAFDPSEEMVTCCACQVTPNALSSLDVTQGLLTGTLTGENPTSAVIKLVATSGTAGTACDPTSAGSAANPLAGGLSAWSTRLHQLSGSTPTFALTETPFTISTLSAGELSHLTAFCGFLMADGSGHGVCKGCMTGGLGAASAK
jgi:hypothetical protein